MRDASGGGTFPMVGMMYSRKESSRSTVGVVSIMKTFSCSDNKGLPLECYPTPTLNADKLYKFLPHVVALALPLSPVFRDLNCK